MNLRPNKSQEFSLDQSRATFLSTFMSRVYGWMMLGVLLTGMVAAYVGNSPQLVAQIFANKLFFYGLIIVQLGAVFYLSARINKISASAAAITFLVYSALMGLTTSLIFVLYTQASIASAFLTTAIAFGGLSLFGYMTKRDLGPIGSFCIMGLFGLIGVMLLSFIFPSMNTNAMQLTYSVIGVLVFSGLTAYDTQRIKSFANVPESIVNQQAILGALVLYLDFINLFLNLMRLMGNRD